MGVTFFVYDPARVQVLEKLIDEMEAEDPLAEVEDSAYDRFAAELEANNLQAVALSDEDSGPAMAFYEWFHNEVSDSLDKLYLTPDESRAALAALEKRARKKGTDELVKGFWHPDDDYTFDVARSYLTHVQNALLRSVEQGGLMVICNR